MKHPFIPLVCYYTIGVVVAHELEPWWLVPLLMSGMLLLWTVVVGRGAQVVLPMLLVSMGCSNYALQNEAVSPIDIRLVQGDEPDIVSLRGQLLERPLLKPYSRDGVEMLRTIARIRADCLVTSEGAEKPVRGEVLVTCPKVLEGNYQRDQWVEVHGVLTRPPGPIADGLFDYRAYLKNLGIYYLIRTSDPSDWRLLGIPANATFQDRFIDWARRTLSRGLAEEDENLQLIWSMVLGWKTGLDTTEVYAPFMQTGTLHIFAISGLHVALFAGILVHLLKILRMGRFASGICIVPILWFYTASTGWQPSAIRATIMMTIVIAGWALCRPAKLLNSLAAAAFIILVWDPNQLFGASFQLSFSVVLSIATLVPTLGKVRDKVLEPNPLLPAELVPGWKRLMAGGFRKVFDFTSTSLAAWVGALPITVYYFNLFNPVTLICNFIMVPISSLGLVAGAGSLLTGCLVPSVSELLNQSGWFLMKSMVLVANAGADLPFAFWYMAKPGVIGFVLYYGLITILLGAGRLVTPAKRVAAGGFLGLTLLAYAAGWLREWNTVRLEVVPLSGGSAVYLGDSRFSAESLIDCGTTNSVDLVLEDFLHAKGVDRLKSMVLTHGDLQHVGGAETVIKRFGVEKVFIGDVRFRSPTYRAIVNQLSSETNKLVISRAGQRLQDWIVLHPVAEDRLTVADENAMVLSSSFHGKRVLLLSDLAPRGQQSLLRRYPDLKADVVVTGLPVSGEPLGDELLSRLEPRLVILTDSEFPASERASPKLLARLRGTGATVISTRTAGAVSLVFTGSKLVARSAAGEVVELN